MKKIVFITGTRADWGKIKSLIAICENKFEIYIFVCGMHMRKDHGRTIDEIHKCGYKNVFAFYNHSKYSSMDEILAKTIEGFSAYVKDIEPDIIIVHGDRVEALAATITGNLNNILTGHIEGGEVTGSCDESLRHSASKMAHLHFVSNDVAKKRLTQMGENPNHIFIIGSPSLDIMLSNNLPNIAEVKMHYNINFANYAILLYHPVVTELNQTEIHARQLVDAVIMSKQNYIVIQPNNDVGTDFITSAYKLFKNNPNIKIFPSMRFEYFQALLKKAKFIIGNSSCGLMEAPYYNTPSINIGSRQNGRVSNTSVINCSNATSEILRAINLATGTPHRLKEAVEADRMQMVNWLLVDPDQSGASLVPMLLGSCYEQLLDGGTELLLTFCRPGLVAFYERLGLEQYGYATQLKGVGLRCPLMLVLRDDSRLRAVRSPLLRILMRSGREDKANVTRVRLEPVVDPFQASQILVNDDLWLETGHSFIERPVPKLFDGIGEDSIRHVMRLASVISCKSGEAITREGETSDDMYLVVSGTFEADRADAGQTRVLGPGDLFGEIEHLALMPRSETVRSTSPGHIVALKSERIFQWMEKNPESGVRMAVNLAKLLAARIA